MRSLLPVALICALVLQPGPSEAGEALQSSVAEVPSPKLLLDGYRRYHSVCNHCHGPDGLGSSFGPSLIDAPPDPENFKTAVLDGARGPAGIMKGFDGNPNVTKYLDAILAYVDARARGELGRGRPKFK